MLPNDLIPITFETSGKGRVEDKCAIACADIVALMTWPVDMAEELKELDEILDKGTDYTQLLQSHLHYDAAFSEKKKGPMLIEVSMVRGRAHTVLALH